MINQDQYVISIGKEQLAALPIMNYPASITVVDTAEAAHLALKELALCSEIGFDTETKPSFRKGARHKVALMQLSTHDRCYLFRLNKIGICSELKNLLQNPQIIKVGLSVHDDFHALSRTENIEPQGFVDLQQLVKKFGFTDISLQKIYAIIFGERISKSQRLPNWEADSLTGAQQAYAALDAWACLKIYDYLQAGKFNSETSEYRHIPKS